jgi:hypothetical protein
METKKQRKAKNRKKMVKATIKFQQKKGIYKAKT